MGPAVESLVYDSVLWDVWLYLMSHLIWYNSCIRCTRHGLHRTICSYLHHTCVWFIHEWNCIYVLKNQSNFIHLQMQFKSGCIGVMLSFRGLHVFSQACSVCGFTFHVPLIHHIHNLHKRSMCKFSVSFLMINTLQSYVPLNFVSKRLQGWYDSHSLTKLYIKGSISRESRWYSVPCAYQFTKVIECQSSTDMLRSVYTAN